MKLLIVDTETTGVDPDKHEILELGAILYSVDHGCILQQFSTLIPVEENKAVEHNGIDADWTSDLDIDLSFYKSMLQSANYVTGHNFSFDRRFLLSQGLLPESKPCLCTMNDFRFPKARAKSKNLREIALDHGVCVWKPHRALTDCKLIADIFDSYTPEELLAIVNSASQPKRTYVSTEAYPSEVTKTLGFSWTSIIPKKWAKRMTEEEYQQIQSQVPFKIIPVS